jgi:aspartyl-tRNA(Asn)/glutamyl-tRNA(Gln) amidotransferase subunit C
MKVSEDDVRYVEDLAHLELTEPERTRMVRDLNSILGYIDRLNELDTSNVSPMAQVSARYGAGDKQGSVGLTHAMRADELTPCLPHDDSMLNAPDTDGKFFRVPKVVEK